MVDTRKSFVFNDHLSIFYSVHILLIAFSSSLANNNFHLEYPWNGDSSTARNEELMSSIRHNMRLPVYKDSVPKYFQGDTSSALLFRDISGAEYLAGVVVKSHEKKMLENIYSYDSDILDEILNSTCATLVSTYWNYEWCHNTEIRQYHVAQDVNDDRIIIREPDWSLGKYSHTDVHRERGDNKNQSAKILSIIQNYSGGQHCDETQEGRLSSVKI